MHYAFVALVLAAAVAAVRVVLAIRRARGQRLDDWDTRLVQNLRAAGGNSFTPYDVDFFFNLPDEPACTALRGELEPEGFVIDARPMSGEGASGFSLHAHRQLRVSITVMQEHSQRFRALATRLGGHYDGWMTDPSRKEP